MFIEAIMLQEIMNVSNLLTTELLCASDGQTVKLIMSIMNSITVPLVKIFNVVC